MGEVSDGRRTMTPATVEASYKDRDVEAYIDILFYRRVGLWLALAAARARLTPNAISIIGALVGLLAGHLYFYRDLAVNLFGMLLHVFSNALDNADGQLARITGGGNRFGRVVDGIADHVVFAGIYLHLGFRCAPSLGWGLTTTLIVAAGVSHALQAAAADVFRNAYLFFVAGQRAVFTSSAGIEAEFRGLAWRTAFGKKLMLGLQRNHAAQQEWMASRLVALREAKGPPDDDRNFAQQYREEALPLMKWINALMTNPRMLVIFIALFLDRPWLYFVAEITLFNGVFAFVLLKHNALHRRLLQQLTPHGPG